MAKREKRVGVHEAKTHLSSLLRDVEKGTEVIVVRGGRPVARIARIGDARSPAESYGMFAGQFVVADDFDAGADDLADLFGVAGKR
jgi:prevent-host-death family protein